MVVIRAFALSIARSFAKLWTRLYTSTAPRDERENRRAEVLSDLHEHIEDSRAEGHRPDEIAVQVLIRIVWGMKDDVAWSMPYLPSTLEERLQRGSESIGHMRTPGFLVAALALLGFMNLGLFMSDQNETWIEWVFLNGSIPIVTFVMWNRERKWARRIINCYVCVMIMAIVGLITWVVLHFRLYENPQFFADLVADSISDLTQFAFALVTVVLMVSVGSRSFRFRAFKGRWWPVVLSWSVIGATSFIIAVSAGLSISLMTWAAMASIAGGFIVICLIFGGASAAVCFVVIRGSAKCLGLMAVGLRRLEGSR